MQRTRLQRKSHNVYTVAVQVKCNVMFVLICLLLSGMTAKDQAVAVAQTAGHTAVACHPVHVQFTYRSVGRRSLGGGVAGHGRTEPAPGSPITLYHGAVRIGRAAVRNSFNTEQIFERRSGLIDHALSFSISQPMIFVRQRSLCHCSRKNVNCFRWPGLG